MPHNKETDPKKIRARIRRYEKKWEKDPEYDDGSGIRFLLGPLYLFINDNEGALSHYQWFEENFPDSADEPFHALGWALAMLRSSDDKAFEYRLKRTHFANVYLLPFILGIEHGQPEIKRGSNWEYEGYVMRVPEELWDMWSAQEKQVLDGVWKSADFQVFVRKHIELSAALDGEPVGKKRLSLVKELHSLY